MDRKEFEYLLNADKLEFVESVCQHEIPTVEIWKNKETGEKFRVHYTITARRMEIIKEESDE